MQKSALVRWFGFPATLVHGDTLVLDRWLWLRRWLPRTRNGEELLDVGCGSGAFTIGAARRGYRATGLSWDERNQAVANERASLCGIRDVQFPIQDVRRLDERADLGSRFEVVLCCENVEHILDDRKLLKDMAACLKPGGRLLLTSPNYFYRPMSPTDEGPFETVEAGGHVRRGYSPEMLRELCEHADLRVEHIGYCSGFLSQMVTRLWRRVKGPLPLRFAVTLPLRLLPPLLDGAIARLSGWPGYSICLVAYKRRWN